MAHVLGERDKPATKINGKFYPLQHQEWVQACKMLAKSQLSVLLYLRTLDPYSNGIRVKSSKIAADLGITKRSVNAAIAVLAERHLIEIEDAEYQLKISSRGRLCQSEPSVTQVGNQFPTEENHFPPEKTISHLSTEFPTEENHFPPEKTISQQESETPTPSGFENPKTNKTLKTQQTLSEAREREIDVCLNKIPEVDREKFLQFARSKASQLPDPPQLVEKWIATHIDWIKQEFDKAYPKEALPTVEDKSSAAVVQKSKNPMGWDLHYLKRLYPDTWRDAAAHFGFEVEEEEPPLPIVVGVEEVEW